MPRFPIAISLCLLLAPTATAQTIIPKHFSAPPEDIRSGLLALPSEQAMTISSRSAMIPLDWTDERGASVRLPLDGAGGVRIAVLSPNAELWDIQLLEQRGSRAQTIRTTEPLAGLWDGSDADRVPVLTSTSRGAGEWTLRVDHEGMGGVAGEAWLAIGSDSTEQLHTSIPSLRRLVGEAIDIRASFDSASLTGATATITDPLGGERTVALSPNKAGAAGSFVPDMPGAHRVHITANGENQNKQGVLRTTTHLVHVAEATALLDDQTGASLQVDQFGASIELACSAHVPGTKVFAATEIWSRGEPVCWVGGMVTPTREGTITIDTDPRWFTEADSGYELRNVRLQDPDSWSVISTAAQLDLDMPDTLGLDRTDGQPDLRGRINPARAFPNLLHANTPRAAGAHNLMLVHGYCSSNVWSTGLGDGSFTGATELFLDLSQNRSHDQFAQLIHATGAASKSYGIVAHSQGGAASLHLYTFYWSGLDWASGGARIQSLGTPYQGTPLAGNLSILGDIFGAGCGENSDMTTDGSPLWLANIPTWARAEVTYWTTSFGSGESWCNFFSGLFLSNPEDGVIEVARGQLTGATNMGNTSGQCHSTDMTDPAQYQDQSRNQFMNGNAAR